VQHIISTKQRQGLSPISTAHDEGKDYFLLAETHNNIAGAATEYNDADTALHHFKVYNKMLTGDQKGKINVADSRLTSSFFNLGMSYTMKEDYENAITNFKEALEEAEKLPDPKNSKLARSLALINLGLTQWLMEDQTEAARLLERALKEREELLGPNDRQSMM
jgi:tetratricopeptide (TPR) repeat protein